MRDALRARAELLAENALLRKQLLVRRRQVGRPRVSAADRWWMVVASRVTAAWREALLIVQPASLLRWHRELHRRWWKQKSKTGSARQRSSIPAETIALIREMATENRLWGAERIRGELLKLGLRVSKRRVQKYMRDARPRAPSGPRWGTFLREHAKELWACDFLQLYDALFRPIFAFFLVEHGSRRIQQLRNATPDGRGPRFLLRDRDSKYGKVFDRVAAGVGARVIRTPSANAFSVAFAASVSTTSSSSASVSSSA